MGRYLNFNNTSYRLSSDDMAHVSCFNVLYKNFFSPDLLDDEVDMILDGKKSFEENENIFLSYLAEHNKDLAFLHAGALSDKSFGMIFAGISGLGKTVLAQNLAEFGFGLYSDDVAVIRIKDLRLMPFPRLAGFTKDSIAYVSKPEICLKLRECEMEKFKLMINLPEYYPTSHTPAYLKGIFFLKGFSGRTSIRRIGPSLALRELKKGFIGPARHDAALRMVESCDAYDLMLGRPEDNIKRLAEVLRQGR